MNAYSIRHKHVKKPEVALKHVRIDDKTLLEVPVTMSDQDARDRFFMRYNQGPRPPQTHIPSVIADVIKEESVGSIEDLEKILEEGTVPEQE